jgi:hypothetical protein
MINEVRDTFAPAQLATASLNFGVGRSQNLCIKSPIEARTPATQNFYQLLSFGRKFLKFDSISCFVFLWDVNRVSPGFFWGACGARNWRGQGAVPSLAAPPAHDQRSLNSGTVYTVYKCLQLSYNVLHCYPRLALDIRL